MRSCRDSPFYFRSWESSVAWVACGLYPDTCDGLDLPLVPSYREAATNFTRALRKRGSPGGDDLVHAYSFCFWTTLAQALPWVLISLAACYVATCLLWVPFQVGAVWVQTVATMLAYTHAGVRDDPGVDDLQ